MELVNINNPIELGEAIKRRRKQLGLSQKDLAAYCKIAKNGMTKIETAQSDVRVSTLFKLSAFLGFKLSLELED
ncbi:MAG: helix-turn-helix transcriptional regulator [Chitinophagaceae bacterium]|nr:helix-turn-helix transcriptional regulator [Oligoflexus sp.]